MTNFSDYLREAEDVGLPQSPQSEVFHKDAYPSPDKTAPIPPENKPHTEKPTHSTESHKSTDSKNDRPNTPPERRKRQDYLIDIISGEQRPGYILEKASMLYRQGGILQSQSTYIAAIAAADKIDQRQVSQERSDVAKQLKIATDPIVREKLANWDSNLHILQEAPSFTRATFGHACVEFSAQLPPQYQQSLLEYGNRLLIQARQVDPEMTSDLKHVQQVKERSVASNNPQQTQRAALEQNLTAQVAPTKSSLSPAADNNDANLQAFVEKNQNNTNQLILEIQKQNQANIESLKTLSTDKSNSADQHIVSNKEKPDSGRDKTLPSGDLSPTADGFVGPLEQLQTTNDAFQTTGSLTQAIDRKYRDAISTADHLDRDEIYTQIQQLKNTADASVDVTQVTQLKNDISQLKQQAETTDQVKAKEHELAVLTAQSKDILKMKDRWENLYDSSGTTRLIYASVLDANGGDKDTIKKYLNEAVAYNPNLSQDVEYRTLAKAYGVSNDQSVASVDGGATSSNQTDKDYTLHLRTAMAAQDALVQLKDAKGVIEVKDEAGDKHKVDSDKYREDLKKLTESEFKLALSGAQSIDQTRVASLDKEVASKENVQKTNDLLEKYFPDTKNISLKDIQDKIAASKADSAECADLKNLQELVVNKLIVNELKSAPATVATEYRKYLAFIGDNDKAMELSKAFNLGSDGDGQPTNDKQSIGCVVKPEENPLLMYQAAMQKEKANGGKDSTLEKDLRDALQVSEKYTLDYVNDQKKLLSAQYSKDDPKLQQLLQQWDALALTKGIISNDLAAVLQDKGDFKGSKILLDDVYKNYKDIVYADQVGFLKKMACAEAGDKSAKSAFEVGESVGSHIKTYMDLYSVKGTKDNAAIAREIEAACKEANSISPKSKEILQDLLAHNKATLNDTNLPADQKKALEALNNAIDQISTVGGKLQFQKAAFAIESKNYVEAERTVNEIKQSHPEIVTNSQFVELEKHSHEPHWYNMVADEASYLWNAGGKELTCMGAAISAGLTAAPAGFGLGALVGIESGPGALITGAIGSMGTAALAGGTAYMTAHAAFDRTLNGAGSNFLNGAFIGGTWDIGASLKAGYVAVNAYRGMKVAETIAGVADATNVVNNAGQTVKLSKFQQLSQTVSENFIKPITTPVSNLAAKVTTPVANFVSAVKTPVERFATGAYKGVPRAEKYLALNEELALKGEKQFFSNGNLLSRIYSKSFTAGTHTVIGDVLGVTGGSASYYSLKEVQTGNGDIKQSAYNVGSGTLKNLGIYTALYPSRIATAIGPKLFGTISTVGVASSLYPGLSSMNDGEGMRTGDVSQADERIQVADSNPTDKTAN